jgi:ankyrin repeat protein
VEKGANVNATDPDGYTPLHYSLRKGISLLRLVTLLNPNGYRQPFSYLLRPDLSKLVKVLLEHGANPNARIVKGTRKMAKLDGSDWPQVGLAGATPFLLAAAEGNVGMMRALLAYGADPTLATNDSVTPLLAAAGAGRSGKGERTKEEEGRYLETVKLLLELGADVNTANINGMTAVHAAAQTAANEVLQFLVERGARLDVKDRYGQTPLSIVEGDPNLLMDDHEVYYHANTAELIRQLGAEPLPNPGRRIGYDEIKGINLNPNEPARAR